MTIAEIKLKSALNTKERLERENSNLKSKLCIAIAALSQIDNGDPSPDPLYFLTARNALKHIREHRGGTPNV